MGKIGGFARIYTIIDNLKKEADPNYLLLHAGDAFVGDFMFNKFFGVPDLAMMRILNFTAMTLGNHEFDLTPPTLKASIDTTINRYGGIPPLLSANLDNLGALAEFVSPYTIRTFGTTKVGIFGLTTTQTNDISFPDPVEVTDPVDAAARVVPVLRNTEHCQVVVLLSHLGLRTDMALAESVPGIDIIIGGHSHNLTPGPVEVTNPSGKTTWIVQAGEHGDHVGKLTFTYGASGVTINGFEAIAVDDSVKSNVIAAALIGTLVDSLKADPRYGDVYANVVAQASIDLDKNPGPGHSKDTPLGNLITDSYRNATGTDIALTANGFLAQKIWAGPVTEADIFQVVPYGYDPVSGLGFRLTTFDITGAELLKGIEFTLTKAEEDSVFLLHVSGMSFKYESARESGGRVYEVLVGGEPLELSRTYSVTVAPFHPVFLEKLVGIEISNIDETALLEFHVVRDYFTALTPIDTLDARVEGRVLDIEAPDTEAPGRPEGVTAARSAGQIRLTWSANVAPDLWYYEILRSTAAALTAADSVAAVIPPETTYVDTGLVDGTVYYYAVAAVDSSGNASELSSTVSVTYATGIEREESLPSEFYLSQNYPNPFNPETAIRYGLPEAAHVSLRIYNITGRLVRTLMEAHLPAGNHLVRWDGKGDNGREVGSGIYFYRIRAGGFARTGRMVLLK